MGFIDSYKHLEKLCGEILNDDRRVSAYIDQMVNTPNGIYYVDNWNDDLKKLKHYRWIRNQIAHEPGCSESNMCEKSDTLWLENFYSRIMSQTDPLSLYHKAISSRANTNIRHQSAKNTPADKQPRKPSRFAIMFYSVFIILAIILAIVILSNIPQ